MQNFDSLKGIWQQPSTTEKQNALPLIPTEKLAAGIKTTLMRHQFYGAIVLVLTALFIAGLVVFKAFVIQHWYTYAGLAMVCIICCVQAGILFATYKKVAAIDETAIPSTHLQQWQSYYALRKQQVKWNLPLYYLFLNMAMGVYFIEMFTGRPVFNVVIFLAIYTAWMLFAWLYLGKKSIKKENDRLQKIMQQLTGIEHQLTDGK